ncbi:MAG TPA: GYD domain-containing protein [Anaerolineaceae bacterium]|nr:GYD domain-containing protein [Anaerolineaceae bacterium]
MQKYLFYGTYTPEGYKGLLAEGGKGRAEAVKVAAESMGGSVEAFYFSFGENDFYVIVNLPDNVNATAFTLTGNVSESFKMKTVILLAPEELDAALKIKVNYRMPGQET